MKDQIRKDIEKLKNSPPLIENEGQLLEALIDFTYQALVQTGPRPDLLSWHQKIRSSLKGANLELSYYTPEKILDALSNNMKLTALLISAFRAKFDPEKSDTTLYSKLMAEYLDSVSTLENQEEKEVLQAASYLVKFTVKTNFFVPGRKAVGFRMESSYLTDLPFDHTTKFPELPFGIFFIKGEHFFGFQIRFKDFARGGFRTVPFRTEEKYISDRAGLFAEVYGLAYTQQKKNKDIPEGGSKAAIVVDEPGQQIIDASQKAFIETLLQLINYDETGVLREKAIVDYWKKPELIFLGPDECIAPSMLNFVADYSESVHYAAGRSFMSSKPDGGINHKEYGVTSLGLFTYMVELLHYMDKNPSTKPFSIKMTGGTDGDVAGNLIKLLHNRCKSTAKVVAMTDGTTALYDPLGLDLDELLKLFNAGEKIANFPQAMLSKEGFLKPAAEFNIHKLTHKDGSAIDLFIPAGGRPRTLNGTNFTEMVDKKGTPTARAIVEGANLYLTPEARHGLEKLGTLIIKDSSANKGGVICSSFEVLAGQVLSREEFKTLRPIYMEQLLALIEERAGLEGKLLLRTYDAHRLKGSPLYMSDISDKISQSINLYKYELLTHLEKTALDKDPNNPLIKELLAYCPPLLREKYADRVVENIPQIHQKAIIAVQIASSTVYKRGAFWRPSIVDLLPLLIQGR